MAEIAHAVKSPALGRRSPWGELFRKEDWWAIWIGLGLIAVALALFAAGSTIKWIAPAPQKWSHLSDVTRTTASARLAIRRSFRALGGGIRHWRGGARHQNQPLSARLSAGLSRRRQHLFSGAVGSGGSLQLGTAARGLGGGVAALQYAGSAPLARACAAGRVLHQDRHCVVGRRSAVDADRLGRAGGDGASRDRFAGDLRRRSMPQRLAWDSIGAWRPRWARAAQCAECRAQSPWAARWAPRSKTSRWPSRWWWSGPSS